jgi:hypothetical protein
MKLLKKIMKSKVDWHKQNLSLETVITDSYKNTQNVRRFFKEHLGDDFHFSREFMYFMKNSVGKTFADVIKSWNAR